MEFLSVIRDERINASSVLVAMTYSEYERLVSGAERNLDIQRGIVRGFKPYERLREDLAKGCLIPAPVLAAKEDCLPPADDPEAFIEALSVISPEDIYIVDGLQRTNAIQQVIRSFEDEEEKEEFLSRVLRVEIWPDISLSALTYRMILLNAGQKPMSLKHQLEVVSSALCDNLTSKFDRTISIYREKDTARRSAAGEYQFSIIAAAFQAFIQKSPHIDVRNEVIAELSQIDALEVYGKSVNTDDDSEDPTNAFVEYMRFLLKFDQYIVDIYPTKRGEVCPSGITLLTRETFHLGLAAAYAWCKDWNRKYLVKAEKSLWALLEGAEPDKDDPLALERLEKITSGFKRKDNVGEQTRNTIFRGFQEYFRSEGVTDFARCWLQS